MTLLSSRNKSAANAKQINHVLYLFSYLFTCLFVRLLADCGCSAQELTSASTCYDKVCKNIMKKSLEVNGTFLFPS